MFPTACGHTHYHRAFLDPPNVCGSLLTLSQPIMIKTIWVVPHSWVPFSILALSTFTPQVKTTRFPELAFNALKALFLYNTVSI